MSFVTPWTSPEPGLEEGIWEVSMPSNVIVNGSTWNFKAQVDPITKEPISTNPITTFDLIAPTSLAYKYELLLLTAIQVHAYYDGQEIAGDGLIVETGYQFTTPATIEVPAGSYTIQLTYLGQTKTSLVDITEGQTIRVDEQFAAPTPIPPLAAAVIVGVPIAGVILWKILKK